MDFWPNKYRFLATTNMITHSQCNGAGCPILCFGGCQVSSANGKISVQRGEFAILQNVYLSLNMWRRLHSIHLNFQIDTFSMGGQVGCWVIYQQQNIVGGYVGGQNQILSLLAAPLHYHFHFFSLYIFHFYFSVSGSWLVRSIYVGR